MATLVGYAGGRTPDPTYQSMGDHSEAIWLCFDPVQISYRQLLEVFWAAHTPLTPAYSRQYRSAVFFTDSPQERIARSLKAELEAARGIVLHTALEPVLNFTPAEDYHQKYTLQKHPGLMAILERIYPDRRSLFRGTLSAKVNAVLGGDAGVSALQGAFEHENVPADIQGMILKQLKNGARLNFPG